MSICKRRRDNAASILQLFVSNVISILHLFVSKWIFWLRKTDMNMRDKTDSIWIQLFGFSVQDRHYCLWHRASWLYRSLHVSPTFLYGILPIETLMVGCPSVTVRGCSMTFPWPHYWMSSGCIGKTSTKTPIHKNKYGWYYRSALPDAAVPNDDLCPMSMVFAKGATLRINGLLF